MEEERFLSKRIRDKAIISGKEYAWYRKDFDSVLYNALSVRLGIIGGQIQFKLPDGTCELYWHKYDTHERKENEKWEEYCLRTFKECQVQFNEIPSTEDIVDEGINSFSFLKEKSKNNVDLGKYLVFIVYFNDLETELTKGFLNFEAIHENLNFRIEEDLPDIGWYLYVYKDRKCIADYLQSDLQSVFEFAREEYNIDLMNWESINNT